MKRIKLKTAQMVVNYDPKLYDSPSQNFKICLMRMAGLNFLSQRTYIVAYGQRQNPEIFTWTHKIH